MSFLDDIQQQPRGTREVMFVLSVIISVSLVGMVWFSSTEKDLYALLNPEEVQQDVFFAKEDGERNSLFASISQLGLDMKASFFEIFRFFGGIDQINVNTIELRGETHPLPLSDDK